MEKIPEEDEETIHGDPEARVPNTLPAPHLPSAKEVAEHNLNHLPYRSWCPICVAAAGREDAHRRGAMDEEGEMVCPTVGYDYAFYGEGAKRLEDANRKEGDVIVMVIKDYKTGDLWAHTALTKGPSDEWLMRRVVEDIEEIGYSDIRLKCDGEPATKVVQRAVIGMRKAPMTTVPINPPRYDPLANGNIEKGVQDVSTQHRKQKLALDNRIGETLPINHPMMEWSLEHAAFLLSRFALGADGKSPYERRTGRR